MPRLGLFLALILALSETPSAWAQEAPEPTALAVQAPAGPLAPAAPVALPVQMPSVALAAQPSAPPGLARFGHWALSDVGAVGATLTPTRLGIAAGFVSLLPLISFQDEALGRNAPRLRGDLGSPLLGIANELGHPRMQWAAGGLFLATLATRDTRLQDAAFTSFEATVYATLLTNVTKGAFGRVRPYRDRGPFAFEPFSDHKSFPSGHTALAFALVTPWVVYYPSPWTYGLFAVSAGTALARLSMERHWGTDVLVGAALGTLTGYWLAKRHLRQTTPLRVTPMLGPEGGALTLTYSF